MFPQKNHSSVVALSGGLDSATLLANTIASGYPIAHAIGFDYGSKHNEWENEAASKIAEHYNVPFSLIDLTNAFIGFKSSLMLDGDEVPEGHYEAETMRKTVVPCRNMIFASILAGFAESVGATHVMLGIHAGDHFIYPDCRPEFLIAMAGATQAATAGKVELFAPFIRFDKTAILKRGLELKVPYHLTRTCYKNQEIACGKCGSCQERLEAFAKLGQQDPIEYETRELIPKENEEVPTIGKIKK